MQLSIKSYLNLWLNVKNPRKNLHKLTKNKNELTFQDVMEKILLMKLNDIDKNK